jgi:hypothetical protein
MVRAEAQGWGGGAFVGVREDYKCEIPDWGLQIRDEVLEVFDTNSSVTTHIPYLKPKIPSLSTAAIAGEDP